MREQTPENWDMLGSVGVPPREGRGEEGKTDLLLSGLHDQHFSYETELLLLLFLAVASCESSNGFGT